MPLLSGVLNRYVFAIREKLKQPLLDVVLTALSSSAALINAVLNEQSKCKLYQLRSTECHQKDQIDAAIDNSKDEK